MFYLFITEAVIESQEHFGNQSVLVAFEMTCVWVHWHVPRGFLLACMNLETLVRRSLSVVDEPPDARGKVSLPPSFTVGRSSHICAAATRGAIKAENKCRSHRLALVTRGDTACSKCNINVFICCGENFLELTVGE